jgi:vesicle-associated membrane protein 2
MKNNVVQVLERDQKISDLGQRADDLQKSAQMFEEKSTNLKRKHRWASMKMTITLGAIGSVILIVIIVCSLKE